MQGTQLNYFAPQVISLGSASFSATDTNQTISLLTGVGYTGVVLDVRQSNGTTLSPYLSYANQDFEFDFRKDGNTVVQYNAYDLIYSQSILNNITPDKPTTSTTSGALSPLDSYILPLAPVFLAPSQTLQAVCHSTVDSQSFSLNIKKKPGVALTITAYGVTLPTSKPVNAHYLYTERISGAVNDTITGFSTSINSYIYGYNFLIEGDVNNNENWLLYLRAQGQEIFNNVPINCLGDVCNLMGASYQSYSVPSAVGGNNHFIGSVRLNYNKRYTQAIRTKSIDDTQFRLTTASASTSSSANVKITHYQMRSNS